MAVERGWQFSGIPLSPSLHRLPSYRLLRWWRCKFSLLVLGVGSLLSIDTFRVERSSVGWSLGFAGLVVDPDGIFFVDTTGTLPAGQDTFLWGIVGTEAIGADILALVILKGSQGFATMGAEFWFGWG